MAKKQKATKARSTKASSTASAKKAVATSSASRNPGKRTRRAGGIDRDRATKVGGNVGGAEGDKGKPNR